jgi:hypothetical protein
LAPTTQISSKPISTTSTMIQNLRDFEKLMRRLPFPVPDDRLQL